MSSNELKCVLFLKTSSLILTLIRLRLIPFYPSFINQIKTGKSRIHFFCTHSFGGILHRFGQIGLS